MKEVKDEFAFSDDSSSKNGESQEVKENIIDDKENINEVVSLADRLKKSVLSYAINSIKKVC